MLVMDEVRKSATFLLLLVMECLLHLCLPSAGNKLSHAPKSGTRHLNVSSSHGRRVPQTPTKSSGHTAETPVSMQLVGQHDHMKEGSKPEPTINSHGFVIAHSVDLRADTWDTGLIPRRPALVRVIVAACTALSIALLGGIAVFCMVRRLVQAEEKQQLAMLYKNVRIPIGDEEDGFEDQDQDESTYLLPENEKELEKFIHSVIKSKRRKIIEKKRSSEKQKLVNEKKTEGVTHHAKMEHL